MPFGFFVVKWFDDGDSSVVGIDVEYVVRITGTNEVPDASIISTILISSVDRLKLLLLHVNIGENNKRN